MPNNYKRTYTTTHIIFKIVNKVYIHRPMSKDTGYSTGTGTQRKSPRAKCCHFSCWILGKLRVSEGDKDSSYLLWKYFNISSVRLVVLGHIWWLPAVYMFVSIYMYNIVDTHMHPWNIRLPSVCLLHILSLKNLPMVSRQLFRLVRNVSLPAKYYDSLAHYTSPQRRICFCPQAAVPRSPLEMAHRWCQPPWPSPLS